MPIVQRNPNEIRTQDQRAVRQGLEGMSYSRSGYNPTYAHSVCDNIYPLVLLGIGVVMLIYLLIVFAKLCYFIRKSNRLGNQGSSLKSKKRKGEHASVPEEVARDKLPVSRLMRGLNRREGTPNPNMVSDDLVQAKRDYSASEGMDAFNTVKKGPRKKVKTMAGPLIMPMGEKRSTDEDELEAISLP